jgi:hypothetical protein
MEGMNNKSDRLYDLLPYVYRQRDAEQGEPLRALLQVISEQVNVVEDDIAQLYENWFIETCEDWVVPYIADLLGFRLSQEAGELGAVTTAEGLRRNEILVPRREVANIIGYRRRKGTASLLELLARDVAGWPARAVEFYQLLGWTQHLNHLYAERGRTVDLRAVEVLDRIDGPFDETAHTVDVRRPNSRRTRGRYNIPSVGLFVWRLNAYPITKAPAYCRDRQDNHFTFSLLGNDTQLFTQPVAEPAPAHIADMMNVPAPISLRAFDERTADYYGRGKSLCIWRDGLKSPIPIEHIVPTDLTKWAYTPRGNQVAVDPVRGRIAFSSSTLVTPPDGVWVTYYYGFSAAIGGGEYERQLRPAGTRTVYRVSQQRPRATPRVYETINDALEAWAQDDADSSIIQIEDSGAYVEQLNLSLRAGQRLEIRAVNGTRPVLRLLDWRVNRPDSINIEGTGEAQDGVDEQYGTREQAENEEQGGYESSAEQHKPTGGSQATDKAPRPSRLVLDGLLITGRSVRVRGDLGELIVRHCTLIPGWTLDHECNPEHEDEPSIELIDTRAQLTIEHSIVGTIQVNQNAVATDPTSISITDSVLDATRPDIEALGGPNATIAHAMLTIERSTIFGLVKVHAIRLAENCIFAAPEAGLQVARTQIGCIRFCYVPPGSHTPRRYHCQPDTASAGLVGERKEQAEKSVRPQFNSVRYGTPSYCQLAETCPVEITRGADDESEMGVFHDLYQPQREASLRARLDEFTPAGMDAGIIFAT